MRDILIVGGNILGLFILFLICTSCTFNLVISHSQGANNDVDADPQTEAEVAPNVKLTPLMLG